MKAHRHSLLTAALAVVITAPTVGPLAAAATQAKQRPADTSASANANRAQARSDADRPLASADIERAVRQRLDNFDGIDASRVNVRLQDGTAIVTGRVARLPDSDRVLEAVSAVRGVENVILELDVRAEERPDADIRDDVVAALKADPATTEADVDVTVTDSTVTLSGTTDSFAEKLLARWIAADVRGVTGVVNLVRVTPTTRDDADLRAAVIHRFASDPLVRDGIRVTARDGTVTLSGEVGSALEKHWAILDAQSTGARRIDVTDLRVNPATTAPGALRPDLTRVPTDEHIAGNIEAAFLHDPRVLSFNPRVEVEDGTVTLSGVVTNLKAKQAAQQIAETTFGVREVDNRLGVQAEGLRPDAQIAQNLRHALERSASVETDHIRVSVTDGRATLTGEADSRYEKWAAADLAARTWGVVAVDNRITVAGAESADATAANATAPDQTSTRADGAEAAEFYYPWHGSHVPWIASRGGPVLTDAKLRENVREQLFWSPFTDAEDIAVTVNDGVVTLRGEVDDARERGAAEDNAYDAGALRVKNELVVVSHRTSPLPTRR